MYIDLNGTIMPQDEATISVLDHGYLYGVGLFETFRTYNGEPFLFAEHLQRLTQSCQHIGLRWEADDTVIRQRIQRLLEANDLVDGYFRFNVAAGAYPVGLPSTDYDQTTEILFAKPLPPPPTSKQLHTVQTVRNTPEGASRLKSHHFLNNILAKRELNAQEMDATTEGIMLTADGHVAEGITSNVFFVRDGCLHTPALHTGILDGITRQFVLRLAADEHIPVQQGVYTLAEAQQADEVFITNSIQAIVPVTRWDDHVYVQPSTDNASADDAHNDTYSADEAECGICRRLQAAYARYCHSMTHGA